MVHRFGRSPPLRRLSPKILERRAVDHRIHGLGHRPPELDQIAARVAGRSARGAPGEADPRLALDGAQQRADRDLVGRLGEAVAPRRAAPRMEKPRPLEPEQHLLEIALRNALAPGDVLDRLERLAVVAQGQIEHRLDSVLTLCGNPHARLRSRNRAASLAKYVMTMSAPARLIPVSASIMAASSSSQPSWPAARSMAYSPDTE